MVRFSGVVCAVLLAGVTAVAGAETVYKWVDGSGQVHYTDLPPRQSDARILGVYQKEAGTIDEEESGDETGDGSGDDSDESGSDPSSEQGSGATLPQEPPPSEAAIAAAAADTLKANVEKCKAAQDRYQKYIDARRLFREVDGKRVYLTDAELTAARARAKQDVTDFCT